MMVVCSSCNMVELETHSDCSTGNEVCTVCQGKDHHDLIPREEFDQEKHGHLVFRPN